jgi:CRISPR/Cas system CSM-associated protein Csm3 (group 7 of RAMP superfamily)
MLKPYWSGDQSRRIVARIVAEGELVLQTPAHFGNGDGDDQTDMPLLLDPLDGRSPLLTGASIAGALRSYLRAKERGDRQPLPQRGDKNAEDEERNSAVVKIFGGFKGDDEGEQSPLIVNDSLGRDFGIEMRDGVSICPESRTAEEDKLYNLQLWQAGTTFPLRFELLLRDGDDAPKLKQALAATLAGFDGGITLGARKRRGYGRVSVAQWRVRTYDLMNVSDLCDWIERGDEPLPNTYAVADLKSSLGDPTAFGDKRRVFTMQANFSLDGSLLIRSGGGQDDRGPDMIHLRSKQANGSEQPTLSGTSLGGALRARALKIANTLGPAKAQSVIEEIFGLTDKASRVSVGEEVVQNATTNLMQNRVSIDRFTGGARDTALFNQQPAFGGGDTLVTVDVQLSNPKDYEIGLLLLLLKDLWTGDLALGGESSVGRGRLKGKSATLTYRNGGTPQTWTISANGGGLSVKDQNGADARAPLSSFVTALKAELAGDKR